jgi:hypothetical protein
MDYLKVVLIQDAAYYKTQKPERFCHAIYNDPLFLSDEFESYCARFDRECKHMTLPENDPTLKHVQLVVPRIGNLLGQVARRGASCEGMLTDLGKALEKDGERAHNERCELYKLMCSSFQRMEMCFLEPMRNDLNLVANFIRGGVNGAIGCPTPSPNTHITAAANFENVVNARRRQEEEFNIPTQAEDASPHSSPLRRAAGFTTTNAGVLESAVGDLETQRNVAAEAPDLARPVPVSNSYQSVLEMYFDWIGIIDESLGLRNLFNDTAWRGRHCKKNSAEMKRMQRMRNICSVIDHYIEKNGIVRNNETIAQAIREMEAMAFGDSIPKSFAWTRYEKAFKVIPSHE